VTIEKTLQSRAKSMRQTLTPAEAVLWTILRTEPLGHWHFRRQVAFPPRYIADFCSHAARLVVEADGEGHVLGHARDNERNAWFDGRGYRVARFENRQVLTERDAVFRELCAMLPERKPPPRAARSARLSPSPQGGGSGTALP
jgi:very-short-patch-repair endonuclease